MSIALLSIVELAGVVGALYVPSRNTAYPAVDRRALRDVRCLLRCQPDLADDVQREWLNDLRTARGFTEGDLAQARAWFEKVLRPPQAQA